MNIPDYSKNIMSNSVTKIKAARHYNILILTLVVTFVFSLISLQVAHASMSKDYDLLSFPKCEDIDPDKFWPDKHLPQTLLKYWKIRVYGNPAEAFRLEAPFFQYLVNFNKYKDYLELRSDAKDLERLEIHSIKKLTQNHFIVLLKTCMIKNDEKKLVNNRRDHWLNVNGKWYHADIDNLLFRNVR